MKINDQNQSKKSRVILKLQRAGALLAIILLLPLAASSQAATAGIEFIGFANATSSAVNKVSTAFVAAGGDLELSFLPFNFNPNRPFANATTLVESTLPSLKGTLTMTVYLGFHQSEPKIPTDGFLWSMFQTEKSTETSGLSYLSSIGWLSRLDQLDTWVKTIRAWAQSKGLGGKLNIVVVPMLEDNCPNETAYANLLTFITVYQENQGVTVGYRRSGESNATRVPKVPLEYHDPSLAQAAGLTKGDTFVNDGFTLPASQFITLERKALGEGVSTLYWTAQWNGYPTYVEAIAPWLRVNIDPFASSGVYSDFVSVLNNR